MSSFDFLSFKDFFDYNLRKSSTDNSGKKNITFKELSARLGYKSPSLLTMISRGERLPSSELLEALFQEWKISAKDREKVRLIVEIEKRHLKGKDHFELASKLHKISNIEKINLKKFEMISDWYILVIKILSGTPDFQEDPEWISAKLRKKISAKKAARALELLEETGYLSRHPQSGKLRPTHNYTETTHDIPSEAIRNNHRGMIQRALESLEEQDVKNRQMNSLALQFDKTQMSAAKKKILQFIHDFNSEFSGNTSQYIYQLNVQLFELTNGDSSHDQ